MEDKRFRSDNLDAAGKPEYDRFGNPIPEDPTFEEMEELLEKIERRNRPEVVIWLEITPSRF